MNIITNQPISSINNVSKNYNNRPVFMAKPKAPAAKDVKQGLNIAHKLYGVLFTPRGESVFAVDKGFAYTKKISQNKIVVAKKI